MGTGFSGKNSTPSSIKGDSQDPIFLVSGIRMALRKWENEKAQIKEPTKRSYETVGYVISGQAELTLEGQTIKLGPGDSWLVPAKAEHSYSILEPFTAIEAISPPR
jgi:quercetin dioxygenase-like cupin family protein